MRSKKYNTILCEFEIIITRFCTVGPRSEKLHGGRVLRSEKAADQVSKTNGQIRYILLSSEYIVEADGWSDNEEELLVIDFTFL